LTSLIHEKAKIMELKSKVAIVTGGAVRIGQAITLALAREGCDVLIHYGRSSAPARDTLASVEAMGARAAIHQADLSDPRAVRGIVPAAISHFGRVDILINNGAIFLPGGLKETTQEMWERQFAINLQAPFFLCQAFADQIPENGHGAIVNITDARIYRPAADHVAYRLTKSALVTMTKTLAQDLAPRITVNALALGAILPPPGKDEEHLRMLSQTRIPLGIPGDTDLVGQNLVHLLRQDFLTGVTIRIDGGEFL
jgi:NAD(P)-dependent dehydrogenase (short-subunit alcohol dehydrogenase family)